MQTQILSYLSPRLHDNSMIFDLVSYLCRIARDHDQFILIQAYRRRLKNQDGQYTTHGDYEFFSSNNMDWNIDHYCSLTLIGKVTKNEHLASYYNELYQGKFAGKDFSLEFYGHSIHIEVWIEGS